jgi:hypothetical protein
MAVVGEPISSNRGGTIQGLRAGRRAIDRRPLYDVPIQVAQLEAKVLAHMASSHDSEMRRSAVEHPNCPPEVLAQLADDVDAIVVIRVARHPNCPPATLAKLAACRTWQVRYEVAKHPGTPGDSLLLLLNDRNKGVRQRCASRRPMPQWLLERALEHQDPVVRYMATIEEPW